MTIRLTAPFNTKQQFETILSPTNEFDVEIIFPFDLLIDLYSEDVVGSYFPEAILKGAGENNILDFDNFKLTGATPAGEAIINITGKYDKNGDVF